MAKDELLLKIRGIALGVFAAVKELDPTAKAKKLQVQGWGDRLEMEVLGEGVIASLRPERSSSGYHFRDTGKVNVVVRRAWATGKQFRDKKAGHDFKAIAAECVRLAQSISQDRAVDEARAEKSARVSKLVEEMNAAQGLVKHRTSVYAYEDRGQFRIRMPLLDNSEVARLALAALKKVPGLIFSRVDEDADA